MEIQRAGSVPSGKGPADWFTGTVRIDPLFTAPEPARVAGAQVTFEPGARTAWHTHPLGQTLIVISGFGGAQRWGGPIEELRPGDVHRDLGAWDVRHDEVEEPRPRRDPRRHRVDRRRRPLPDVHEELRADRFV